MGKTLVAYFSCSGITEGVAKKLCEAVNGELYKITPTVPYTSGDLDWQDNNSRSTKEMNNPSIRPQILGQVENMDEYDKVFVGFPIWWYIEPNIINTFLESYDFSGKTVIPFATSGESEAGKADEHLHKSCSDKTKWKPAKRFPADVSVDELKKWVNGLDL